jgi:hypothetical protein
MSEPPPRRSHPRLLADFVAGCLDKALAAQGFAQAEIVTRWGEIAGPELAARSRPLQLQWPRRRSKDDPPEPATLVVRVEGAFALDLQQQAPVLIERVNRHLGWRGVGRLKLKPGPVARPTPRPPASPAALSPAAEAALAGHVAGVADEGLADALRRLGRGVVVATR